MMDHDIDTKSQTNIEIKKWENSLAVRIPRHLAHSLHLHDGSPVAIEVWDGALIIRPQPLAWRRERITLGQLLGGVTPASIHRAEDWGESVGHEV